MEIGNKISQLFGKDDINSSQDVSANSSISDNKDISIFNNEDIKETDKGIDLAPSITNDNDKKENLFTKIKDFIFSIFKIGEKKDKETETINDSASTEPTKNISETSPIQEQKPTETKDTPILTDSNTINGEIDEKFSQSTQTGDCVLLSTILALSYTDKGAEMIKDSIKTNKNQNGEIESYSVTFAGINETYTISKKELEDKEYEAVSTIRYSDEELVDILGFTEEEVKNMREEDKWFETHSLNHYSNGDSDVLLLELATEKCFNETDNSFIKAYISATMSDREGTEHANLDVLNLNGIPPQLLSRMLTGNNYVEKIDPQNQLLDKINNGSPIIMSTSNKPIRILDINNKEIELIASHAYAVKSATNDTITIVNPHDSSVQLTFNKDDLLNLDGLDFQAYYL